MCLLIIWENFRSKFVFHLPLATSIYPGRGGPLDSLFPDNKQLLSDEEVEDENDWMGNEPLGPFPTKSSQKKPSKFSESIAIEASTVIYTISAYTKCYVSARDLSWCIPAAPQCPQLPQTCFAMRSMMVTLLTYQGRHSVQAQAAQTYMGLFTVFWCQPQRT